MSGKSKKRPASKTEQAKAIIESMSAEEQTEFLLECRTALKGAYEKQLLARGYKYDGIAVPERARLAASPIEGRVQCCTRVVQIARISLLSCMGSQDLHEDGDGAKMPTE